MKVSKHKYTLLLALFFLGACQKNAIEVAPQRPQVPPIDPQTRIQILENAVIVDETGVENPVQIEGSGLRPFGLLYELPGQPSSGAVCTVTHYRNGIILTAAHCVDDYPKIPAHDFYVVYYNKFGNKAYAPIQSIIYLGTSAQIDMAVLKVAQPVAESWDTLDGNLKQYEPDEVGSTHPHVHSIRLWTIDPFDHYPNIEKMYAGRQGGVFMPRDCLGSRTAPQLLYKQPDELPIPKYLGATARIDYRMSANENLFMDHCSLPIVRGNSGALISERDNPQLVHAIVSRSSENFSTINRYYVGNKGLEREFDIKEEQIRLWKDPSRRWRMDRRERSVNYYNQMFSFGTVVEQILPKHPELSYLK